MVYIALQSLFAQSALLMMGKVTGFLVLAALLTACGAVRHPRCRRPDLCDPRVIEECPRRPPIAECTDCCCSSTENIEFYDPRQPEPRCTAPPARYQARFVSTWAEACHSDYYLSNAHWSWPTGASHNPSYTIWDACMDNVSDGVAVVSQIGQTHIIEMEYAAQGDNVLDTYRSPLVFGVGDSIDDFVVDKDHQYVSGVTMLAPSLDHMMGVSRLRLCNGHDWIRRIKVCGELFSTATRHPRAYPGRNTIQYNNCSFGYFEYRFLEYLNPLPEPFPGENSTFCQDQRPPVCPREPPIPTQGCRTCCCRSSPNMEFYRPNGPNRECTARGRPQYKITLRNTWTPRCHSENYPDGAGFGPLLAITHDPTEILNRCHYDPEPGIMEFIQTGNRPTLEVGEHILDVNPTPTAGLHGRRTRLTRVDTDAAHSYVTVLSRQMPGEGTYVGVSRLQLCEGERWKERVDVCLELVTINGEGEDAIAQNNNCSFGYLSFEIQSPRPPGPPPTRPPPPGRERPDGRGPGDNRVCHPHRVNSVENATCCNQDFIVEGHVVRIEQRPNDRRFPYRVLFEVLNVHYDELSHIQTGEVIEVKLCGLSSGVRRIGPRSNYLLMGERECRTNDLIITDRGCFEPRFRPRDGMRCTNFILNGGCAQEFET